MHINILLLKKISQQNFLNNYYQQKNINLLFKLVHNS